MLTRKDEKWWWEEAQQKVFDKLKRVFMSRTESGGMEVWIGDRNYTPFQSNVQRRRGMYLAMIERRLR